MAFWNRWFSQADTAREAAISRSSVQAAIRSGELPQPMDPEDDHAGRGWPAPVVDAFVTKRAGRRVSPAVATMPTVGAEPLPLLERKLVRHRVSVDGRQERTSPSLATVYQSTEGKLVIIEPLTEGETVPGREGVQKPQQGRPRDMAFAPFLVAALEDTAKELGLDPFEHRWVVVSPGSGYELSESGAFHEVIVKALDPKARPPFARDWPFEAAMYELSVQNLADRLGREPEMLPSICRTVETVEILDRKGWEANPQVAVDFDRSAQTAYYTSVLEARQLKILSELLMAEVTAHEKGEAYEASEFQWAHWLPRGAHSPVQLTYPEVPARREAPSAEQWSAEVLRRVAAEAQDHRDLLYGKWGEEPNPVIERALEEAEGWAVSRLRRMEGHQDELDPAPAYFVRHARDEKMPWKNTGRSLQDAPPLPGVGFKSRARAVLGEAFAERVRVAGDNVRAWGAEAVAQGRSEYDGELVAFCTVSSLRTADRDKFRQWKAIVVHHDAQLAPIGVELADGSVLPMPLRSNPSFTAGYGGSGPANTAEAVLAFLTWVSGRGLSEAERLLVRDRLSRDQSEWVRLEHGLFLDL